MPQYLIKPKLTYRDADKKLSGKGCYYPFVYFGILAGGDIFACCPTWVPKKLGNILSDTVDEVLNNPDRVIMQNNMRKSIFDDCNDYCPQLSSLLTDVKNQYWSIVPLEQLENYVQTVPYQIVFSYDPSCNLQCPSCRNELIYFDPSDLEDQRGQQILKIHNRAKELVNKLLYENKKVIIDITGSGDAFASPLYWNYLLELANNPIPENLKLTIRTNGVLMTKEKWDKLRPLWPIIHRVEVSVDAVNEDTYKIVRKNGNFIKLKKNLEHFDELVFNGAFPNLVDWITSFVVQKDNYKELKEYVNWQLTFKSQQKICFLLIAQWQHLSDKQYKTMAVWHEDHKCYAELIEILKDPIFHLRRVWLRNMAGLINQGN
jgi:pyruvate-formate lyase-activating enzyme